jgi:N-acetylglutamate synthase-like GNAT family acetyltransferase
MRIRKATKDDMPAIAVLHRHTMRTSLPYLPDLHTPQEDLMFFRDILFAKDEVWVAEIDETIVGYVARSPGWIDHLYVHPDHHARRIGDALLKTAMADVSELQLWAFQQNARARTFYEARGFVLVRLTDGSGNDEKTPDALYRWARPITND